MSKITIQEARKAIGMTQEELAKAIGVTQGAISQLETGLTKPSIRTLKQLADVLGISIEELIDGVLAS